MQETPQAQQTQEALGQAIEAEGAAKTTEAPNEALRAQGQEEKPKETASALLAKLARQRKEQMEASKKLSAVDAEKAQLQARLKELEERVTKKPQSPIEALEAAGFSYKDATDFVLNNSNLTPEQQIKAVREEIESMRRSQEEERTRLKEEQDRQAKANYERAIADFKSDIGDFVETNKEKFELTHLYQGQELIYELISQHYENTLAEWREKGSQGRAPRVMSIEEAAELVEKDFEEKVELAAKTKKLSSKFAPPAQADPGAHKGTPAKTLANTVTASASSPGRINDPVARAMAALDKLGR